MTASATAPIRQPGRPAPRPAAQQEFDLVESSAGWRLTVTLTDRLREALARGGEVADARFTVRIAPNLVPGEPFEAELVSEEPGAQRS
jgi:hypothetical protein